MNIEEKYLTLESVYKNPQKNKEERVDDMLYNISQCDDMLYKILVSIESILVLELIDEKKYRSFDKEIMNIIRSISKLEDRITKELN